MEFSYDWSWDLPASPAALWPLVSDTNRFNRDTNLPTVEVLDETEGLTNARKRLRFQRFGVVVEWEETPFEWVRPWKFGVVRRYSRGPVKEMRVHAELTPLDEETTRLDYRVRATPSGPLGYLAIPIQIGLISRLDFGRVFRRYAEEAVGTAVEPIPTPSAPGFQRWAESLRTSGVGEDLASALSGLVEDGDPIMLSRIRPYQLADLWHFPRESTLMACLVATRSGLLELRWNLLCPMCRGVGEEVPTLSQIRREGHHCDTCLEDFSVDFDQSVELAFRPPPEVRGVLETSFCVAGPQVTPHVQAQVLMKPGSAATLAPVLEPGRYRLRALGVGGGRTFQVGPGGLERGELTLAERWDGALDVLGTRPQIDVRNKSDRERLVVLERTEWADDVTTAADVTGLRLFRDLFSSEVLAHGDFHSVRSLTVLFTDLKDSTRLYREVGDAPAFSRVMAHFDHVMRAVEAHGGTVVKTIGDAVMATFPRRLGAVLAVEDAVRAMAASEDAGGLRLKAGAFEGPCILVTLNDRLDYFGSSVNIASRLAALAEANSVVVPSDWLEEDTFAEWKGETVPRFDAELRGIEDVTEVAVLRVE